MIFVGFEGCIDRYDLVYRWVDEILLIIYGKIGSLLLVFIIDISIKSEVLYVWG